MIGGFALRFAWVALGACAASPAQEAPPPLPGPWGRGILVYTRFGPPAAVCWRSNPAEAERCDLGANLSGAGLGGRALLVQAQEGAGGPEERLVAWEGTGRALEVVGPWGAPGLRPAGMWPDGAAVGWRWGPVGAQVEVVAGGEVVRAYEGLYEPAPGGAGVVWAGMSGPDGVEVVTVRDGGPPMAPDPRPGDDLRPRPSPDGRLLAWLRVDGGRARAWVRDLESGRTWPLIVDDGHEHHDLVWSPSGARIAVVAGPPGVEPGLSVVDGPSGRPLGRVTGPGDQPSFSPDERWLAYRCGVSLCVASVRVRDARVVAHGEGNGLGAPWFLEGG